MVGAPKSLSDLHRVEAQIRVTCRGCSATEVWELDALIAEVRENGGNTEWRAAHLTIKCPRRCSSPLIVLEPIPFGKRRARRTAHRTALIDLALQILHDAARRSSSDAVGTVEVRLALHVLRPFTQDSASLVEFWTAATTEPRHPWTSCHLPYRLIVQQLVDRGEAVDKARQP